MRRGKKGAIELSIGTIVIVVLAMSMLILGIILVRNIFSGTEEAVTNIHKGVIAAIDQVFTKADAKLAVYPTRGKITLKQGSKDGGFAFSVRNIDVTQQKFTWTMAIDDSFNIKDKCPDLSVKEANSWLLVGDGSFTLPPGSMMEDPELVVLSIPDEAPPCVLKYRLDVKKGTQSYAYRSIIVTIQGK